MTKLLIVEDDPLISEQLVEEIQDLFPNIIEIVGPLDNYLEGVDMVNTEQPDIALLDIELKGDAGAGIKLAQYINQTSQIPIIFLSGLPKNLGFDKAKYTLPYAFLKKPYDTEGLSRVLEMAMIFQTQKERINNQTTIVNLKEDDVIYVCSGRSEYKPLPVKELICLVADDKYVNAYLTTKKTPIMFNSALKTFYRDRLTILRDFFQLDRKHVINLKMIHEIKDNHVFIPRPMPMVKGSADLDPYFRIPIPRNSKSKEMLFQRLNIKV